MFGELVSAAVEDHGAFDWGSPAPLLEGLSGVGDSGVGGVSVASAEGGEEVAGGGVVDLEIFTGVGAGMIVGQLRGELEGSRTGHVEQRRSLRESGGCLPWSRHWRRSRRLRGCGQLYVRPHDCLSRLLGLQTQPPCSRLASKVTP